MRVVAVVPLYPPRSRVGAWLATHSLLRGLLARGHDVHVVPFMATPAHPYEFEGMLVSPGAMIRTAVDGADVVLAHASADKRDPLEGMRLRAPLVRLVHGLPVDPVKLAGCSLIVANSQSTAAAFSGWSIPVVVCHPATDPAEFRTTPGDRVTLVNLTGAKGGATFWAAAQAMPDVEFLGVRGGYGSQIEKQLPNVEILGPVVSMRDWVYARTRLLVMPSQAETWGMVAVEAMHSGIPVLACPTPGLRESLGAAGNWCATLDAAEWVPAIRRMLEPEMWAEASGRALGRAAELDPEHQRTVFADAVEKAVADA